MLSKGEEMLIEVLEEEIPSHTKLLQHPIKIGKRTLYFDVYIPMLKMAFEFDGLQHFIFTKFFHHTIAGFQKARKNDFDKNEYCNVHGINVMRIPHDVVDKETMKKSIRKFIKAISFDVPLYEK